MNEVSQRLILCGRRQSRGIARIEYSSESLRQQVVQSVQPALTQAGIAYREIALIKQQTAEAVIADLLTQLEHLPGGIVSISGFDQVFPSSATLADDLRILNFNRERYLRFPGQQFWWMSTDFLQKAIHGIPDIDSYFSPRLTLDENK